MSRQRLKDYSISKENNILRKAARGKQTVELSVFHPKGDSNIWMYVQSDMEGAKEGSMSKKRSGQFEEELKSIRLAFDKKEEPKR